MKAAITSDGCEQLAKYHLAPALGLPFYNFLEWDQLWGNPLEPDIGEHPECVVMKGFFGNDYSGQARIKKVLGDMGKEYQPKCSNADKVAVLWAGSDVTAMFGFRQRGFRYEPKIFSDLRSDRFVHIPVNIKQKYELDKLLGIEATDPLPTPSRKLFDVMPMPGRFTVAVYLPTYRADFFRYKLMLEVAEKMPEARFIFFHWMFPVGDSDVQLSELPNVEYRYHCSREEYEDIVKQSACLLRAPQHEGLSGTAADFLLAGRPVVSCWDMPEWPAMLGNELIDNGKHDAEYIVKLLNKMKMEVPEETRQWYLDNLAPAKYKERFNERIHTKWPEFSV
ncbi:MAG: hypothetical protein GF388_01065 [Candidatus Aegiribacteria sp.]|nr:hypothetical protein [Candidatus Aegiribacteria sp.]